MNKVIQLPRDEDNDPILHARIRLLESAKSSLEAMEAILPQVSSPISMERSPYVEYLFAIDLHYVMAWLTQPKCTLDELHMISVILNRWDKNHKQTIRSWRNDPTEEEAKLNRRIVEVCERLRAKGQFTEETNVVSFRN